MQSLCPSAAHCRLTAVAVTAAGCFAVHAAAYAAAAVAASATDRKVRPGHFAVKTVSAAFGVFAVRAATVGLLYPEAAVAERPLFGYSAHSQVSFAIAAGFFAWAFLCTLAGGLNQRTVWPLLHHTAASWVFYVGLHPFLHYVGHLFLLFQASTLVADLNSLGRCLGLWGGQQGNNTLLWRVFPVVFVVLRILIGVPISLLWSLDMIDLLRRPTAGAPASWCVASMIAANALLNLLNIRWSLLMVQARAGLPAPLRTVCGIAPPVDDACCSAETECGAAHHRCAVHCGEVDAPASPAAARSAPERAHGGVRAQLKGIVPLPAGHQERQTLLIHGKWYDVSDFTDHPGGPVALAIGAGRDATGLFEMHHFRGTAQQGLKRFELSEEEVARRGLKCDEDAGHFEWEGFTEDAFVRDLRAAAMEYFQGEARRRGVTLREATKATPWRWVEICVFSASFVIAVPFMVAGNCWAAPAVGLGAWLYTVNYWHDALHFALSSNWRLNALLPYLGPWFCSPYMWYHQHVIGHHVHTNVARRDPDLAHAPLLMREHGSVKHRPAHKTQHSWWHTAAVWSVAVSLGLNLINDLRAHFKGSYNNAVLYRRPSGWRLAGHILGRVMYFFCISGWPWFVFSPAKALYFATVPAAVYSLLFMVTSQLAHLVPHAAHASSPNFYKHQLATTQDFAPPPHPSAAGLRALAARVHSRLTFYFSGGLNLQVEHHLFPSVCHCHLPALHHRVLAVCRKHGVPHLAVSGYAAALQQHMRHSFDMSRKKAQ